MNGRQRSLAQSVPLPRKAPNETSIELDLGRPFDSFYRSEYASVVALSTSLVGSFHVGEEIAQEAFVAAYRSWPTVGVLDSPIGWVRRVVVNKSVSVIRRRVADARAMLRIEQLRDPVSTAPDAGPVEMSRLLRRLPRRQAQVVALFYVADLSVVEVAHTMGCAPGTVKAHLHMARANLAVALEEGA